MTIALIGMPRSGTTWVAKGVDRHKSTYYMHEPDSEKKIAVPHLIEAKDIEQLKPICSEYLNNISDNTSLKVVGRLPFYPKQYLSSVSLSINKALVFGAKVVNRIAGKKLISNLNLIKFKTTQTSIFWKSIESPARLNLLAQADPDIKIAYIVRHPCGVINSELRGISNKQFDSSLAIFNALGLMKELVESTTGQKLGFDMEQFKKMSPAQRLAVRWLIYNEKALDDIEQNSNVKLFVYEDICETPEKGFESLYQHFNLTDTGEIKSYINETTTSEQSEYYSINKDPLKSAMKWRSQLSEQDQQDIFNILKGTRSYQLFEKYNN